MLDLLVVLGRLWHVEVWLLDGGLLRSGLALDELAILHAVDGLIGVAVAASACSIDGVVHVSAVPLGNAAGGGLASSVVALVAEGLTLGSLL